MHTNTILHFFHQWITGQGSLPKALLFQNPRTILAPTNGILPPANAGDSLVRDPAWQAMVSSMMRRGYRPTGSLARQPKRHKARSAEIINRAACARSYHYDIDLPVVNLGNQYQELPASLSTMASDGSETPIDPYDDARVSHHQVWLNERSYREYPTALL